MRQELRIKNYELRRGFIFLLLTSYFLLLVFVAAPPAFADVTIVPTDCYEQGDYSLGAFLDIAQNIMKFVWSISGAFALLMFFFGGILWLVSAGEDKRVTQGRDTMVQAATGLIIVLGSWVFVNFVVAALHGETDWTKTATVFDKDWSSYNTGYGGSPCLGQYWKDKFPLFSAPPPPPPATTQTVPAPAAAPAATVTRPKCCFIVEQETKGVDRPYNRISITVNDIENGIGNVLHGIGGTQYNIYEPFKAGRECVALNLQNYEPAQFKSTYVRPIYTKYTIVNGTKRWCPKNCPEAKPDKSNWITGACRT